MSNQISKRLKYLVTINEHTLPDNFNPDQMIHYVDIGSVDQDGKVMSINEMSFQNAPSRARRILKDGDTIVSTVRTYLKAIAFIDQSSSRLIGSTGFAVLSPKKNIEPKFLFYLMRSTEMIDEIVSRSVGVSYPAINASDIGNINVKIPEMDFQKLIVHFLDKETFKIDNLIEKKQRLIELLQEKRQALITNAVTKGLDPNASMKDSGIPWLGKVPEHWEVVKLKHLKEGTLTYGANESADIDNPEFPRFIRITDIDSNGNLRPDTFKSLPYDIAKDYLLNDEDLLFARSGATVGKVIMYKSEWGQACFAGYLIRFRANRKKALPKYIWYFTQGKSYWSSINSDTIQSTIQNFSADKYGNIDLVIPEIGEQKEITEYLDKVITRINVLTNRIQTQITKLQEYRQALITAVVTGKVDVREKVSS